MFQEDCTPSYSQTVRMKKLYNSYLLDADTIRSIMAEEKANQREKISFHVNDLRHSFAVNSLMIGDDVKTVQTNLGHATASFTLDVYGHVTQKMKNDSAERMQQFWSAIRVT